MMKKITIVLLSLLLSPAVWAHAPEAGSGLLHGIAHPFSGIDHMLAMVMIGLWASQAGKRAERSVLSLTLAVMAVAVPAGAYAGAGAFIAEPGIVASLLVLGLLLAATIRLPLMAGTAIAGLFAVFHGYAHGAEIAASANLAGYAAGLLVASACLQLAGMAIGRYWLAQDRRLPARLIGAFGIVTGLLLAAG